MSEFTRQEERFDVVDSADVVIGSATRREVHERRLLHRAVHIVVYNAAGEIFLQLRSPLKDRCPNCWDCSCSGHVDSGEDYETAALRELGEELGLKDRSLTMRPFAKLSARPETGEEFIQLYVLGPIEGPFDLNAEEISEGRFFSLVEVDALVREKGETWLRRLVFGGWSTGQKWRD